jgi:glycosyltransferase involved in cell wall biosynthesis
VAISRSQLEHAPPGLRVAAVVPNPIVLARWPMASRKQDYLLWIGRMDPVKGAPEAIEAARLAGRPLVLAGPVQTGQADFFRECVEPHIDGERVRYVGEVGGARRQELYAGAAATLMPIRWEEPFGMVMVESLACGTPVIAFARGAATEIVIDGENGRLVADTTKMADAVGRLGSIDPVRCRESVRERYDIAIVTDGYGAVYRRAAGLRTPPELACRQSCGEILRAG